jgi:hypothetical protein
MKAGLILEQLDANAAKTRRGPADVPDINRN